MDQHYQTTKPMNTTEQNKLKTILENKKQRKPSRPNLTWKQNKWLFFKITDVMKQKKQNR
jgi:hypothetical protein